ncbi:MAG TPA: WG repeat-containing protein [Cyclobacteriaceae bacterium]
MRINVALFLFLFLVSLLSEAQISPERAAQARIQKGKWAKAEKSIKKAIRKDSINPEAKFVYAQWYFESTNPDFQIDSAYQYAMVSMTDYGLEDLKQRDRMERFPLDSSILLSLRARIDSAAFERAKIINTELAYQKFLDKFIYASQKENAIELRDEVAFLDALKMNTYQSFDQYLKKYPESHRTVEAKSRYEKLLFEDKTGDRKLKSYVSFYKNYPNSPYRAEVHQQIFEISTASGELKDYLNFISTYKEDLKALKKAKDIAYHIARQQGEVLPKLILSDSLKLIIQLQESYWVPFLKNDRFGFINESGREIISPRFKEIDQEYLCGNVTADVMITSEGVVSRGGDVIFKGQIESIDDLGFGILLLHGKSCNQVIHKSGFKIDDNCIEDTRIVAEHFVAIQKNKKWSLYSFAGKKLIDNSYDDIRSEEEIIVLTRRDKKILNTVEQVIRAADSNLLPENMVFDEVRKLSSEKVLVKNGPLEGVVNSELEFEIPLDRQILTLTSFGFTKRVLNKVSTVGSLKELDNAEFNDIRPYLNWLGLYRPLNIKLYHLPSAKIIEEGLDSLWFANRLAMALKRDSLKVIFGSGRKMVFPSNTNVTFVKSPDSVRYFYLEEKGNKQLYDVDTGLKRFALEFDKIEELGYGVFLIEHKGKKGLVNLEGKPLLPIEYEAIVRSGLETVSLLKEKKFGIYDLLSRKLVKANYERNLTFFNDSLLVAYKDGFYGFITRESDPISTFEFDEVRPWSDSSAFVKKGFRWMIYNIYEKKITSSSIKDYQIIKDSKEEKIAIVHQENEYGVLSSTKGVIIPSTFSDVLNLGTPEKPLYFTEKNVEEADIFVVIYYDEKGVQIRREIYEAEEYDRIYCR